VLVSTSHPGNIGAAARAIKTMGLSQLVLVNPRKFPDPGADALAVGAGDVLAAARVCAALDEALQGTVASFGFSARRRELSHVSISVREAAGEAIALAADADVALVFGAEMSGLTNEDLIRCGRVVHIPTTPHFSSLNLAQAVQIAAYEVWVAAGGGAVPRGRDVPPAAHEDLERFFVHLERVLVGSGFLDPAKPRRLMDRLRRLFVRARPEEEEVNILRGILTAVGSKRGEEGGAGEPR
jgi:tRNA/rRNA methyltransferase